MQSVDDWELVARAQGGSLDAFEALVRRYQGPVIHFCRRMVGSQEDAEDLAQECFVRLYRHLARLKPKAKFSTVVFGIARNLALNFVRDEGRRGRGRRVPAEDLALAAKADARPDERARVTEIGTALETALEQLTVEHREILLLREMQGLDYDGIARVLRCRKGTVRSRLARAREQLRLRLLDMGGDLL